MGGEEQEGEQGEEGEEGEGEEGEEGEGEEQDSAQTVLNALADYDTDKDGKLSQAELFDAYPEDAAVDEEHRKKALAAFVQVDEDQDGSLDSNELANFVKALDVAEEGEEEDDQALNADGSEHEADAQSALLEGYDSDKDGKLSKQELSLDEADASVQAAFVQVDEDKDGSLDSTELANFRKVLEDS